MMLMGFGNAGLGDWVIQYANVDNLPNCLDVNVGSAPCRNIDGSLSYVFTLCSEAVPGSPCFYAVNQQGPTPVQAPDGTPIQTLDNDPFLTAETKKKAKDEAARREQIKTLTNWGVALAIGLGAGLALFKWRG